MAMNRESKRKLQKEGESSADDGEPVRKSRAATSPPGKPVEKVAPVLSRQGLREVRSELRKVAWPTRQETLNYSLVVLVTLVIVTLLIFGIDWVFSKAVLKLFES